MSTTDEALANLLKHRTSIGRTPFNGLGFYPSRENRYVIYSIGIDRFIMVDDKDLWITLHTAKLLSSKLPTAVFALDKDAPQFANEDAMFWTITDKNIYQGGEQCPIIGTLVGANSIAREGAPLDYVTNDQLNALATLQDYALFVNKVLYSIRFADAMLNPDDHNFFADLMGREIRDILEIRADHTPLALGYRLMTEQILYRSSSIEAAMDKINRLWQRRNRFDNELRKAFFDALEVPQPPLPEYELPKI